MNPCGILLDDEQIQQLRQTLANALEIVAPLVPNVDPPETTQQAFLQITAVRLEHWLAILDGLDEGSQFDAEQIKTDTNCSCALPICGDCPQDDDGFPF